MKRTLLTVVLLSAAGLVPAFAQDTTQNPPVITNVTMQYMRGNSVLVPVTSTTLLMEGDIVIATLTVVDEGFPKDKLYLRRQSYWLPLDGYPVPVPPPIDGDSDTYAQVSPAFLDPSDTTVATVYSSFLIPDWQGVNQARIQQPPLIDWDVRWRMTFEVLNEEKPKEDVIPSMWSVLLYAVENTATRTPNGPPAADAGPDQIRALNPSTGQARITLDASRTFDAWNVGFNFQSANVFEKNTLNYTWEWLSGPKEITASEITPDPEDAALAYVTLDRPGDYIFRVLVDNGVSPTPSVDTVKITIVTTLPPNQAPLAVAVGPSGPVAVGALVSLDGSGSSDPNTAQSTLSFRWRQTNEVGGNLAADELATAFQPLSGLSSPVSTWRATATGRFYFRLLVTDPGGLTDAANLSVEVVAATASSAQAQTRDTTASSESAATNDTYSNQTALPAACGSGIVSLALVPLALWFMRGRIR